MNQTSIALHLARVMGKEHALHTYPDGKSQAVLLCYDDGGKQMWWPENNLHQWAECVLWAAMNGHTLTLQKDLVTADFGDAYANPADNTPSGIQAATLEAIARATGFDEMEGD